MRDIGKLILEGSIFRIADPNLANYVKLLSVQH